MRNVLLVGFLAMAAYAITEQYNDAEAELEYPADWQQLLRQFDESFFDEAKKVVKYSPPLEVTCA